MRAELSQTEKLCSGDTGRGRGTIRVMIENTMVGEDGKVTPGVEPEALLGAQTIIAHSGSRGSGLPIKQNSQS